MDNKSPAFAEGTLAPAPIGEGENPAPGGENGAVADRPARGNEGGDSGDRLDRPGAVPQDLNALLTADKALQSQFDKLVAKAIHTAVGNAKAKWEQEKDMTPEQRADAEKLERDRQLAEREQAIAVRELRAEALSLLGERGLPPELIGCVALSGQEAMEASLMRAESAFRTAVDRAVREKLAGTAPKSGQGTAGEASAFQAKIDKYAQKIRRA